MKLFASKTVCDVWKQDIRHFEPIKRWNMNIKLSDSKLSRSLRFQNPASINFESSFLLAKFRSVICAEVSSVNAAFLYRSPQTSAVLTF